MHLRPTSDPDPLVDLELGFAVGKRASLAEWTFPKGGKVLAQHCFELGRARVGVLLLPL